MKFGSVMLKTGVVALVLGLTFVSVAPVEAGEDATVRIKARAVSTMNITRAAADLLDIEISRWTTADERAALADQLQSEGNKALAAALEEEESTGWVAFDPRGGGGPGRHPRRVELKYARVIKSGDSKEIILVSNHYPGYASDSRAADGAKLTGYPVSFILLKLHSDDDGKWTGVGRMFVGSRLRYDTVDGKFVIDEFPRTGECSMIEMASGPP